MPALTLGNARHRVCFLTQRPSPPPARSRPVRPGAGAVADLDFDRCDHEQPLTSPAWLFSDGVRASPKQVRVRVYVAVYLDARVAALLSQRNRVDNFPKVHACPWAPIFVISITQTR
jgi:hypothetical protein